MKNIKTLVTLKLPEEFRPELEEITTDYKMAGRGFDGVKLDKEQMIQALQGCELVLDGIETIDAEVMDACPDLKIIVCGRNEAFGSIDIDAATERGIPVISAVGRNAVSVAEWTIGLLFAVSKKISEVDYLLKHTDQFVDDEWEKIKDKPRKEIPSEWAVGPGSPSAIFGGYPEFTGKKFGQIGYGSIGREVAKRAHGLLMELLICDPFLDPKAIEGMNARIVTLEELMRESDFISINCNVTPSTRGMVSRDMINLMKPTAYIVNTARHPIMDYDALYDALVEHRIAGAALDVYPVEPIPKDYKFRTLDNVVLTPHLAAQSREMPTHMNIITMRNLKMLLRGERPQTICNPQVLDEFFSKHADLLVLKK